MSKQSYRKLKWDSDFFGYKIAIITNNSLNSPQLNIVISSLRQNNYRLAYWFVDGSDIISINSAIENNGFLADEKVTYRLMLDSQFSNKTHFEIENYNETYAAEELIQLAIQSGEYSRFKIDPHFGKSEFERLYKEWIVNSVSGKIADGILVYRVDQRIVGIITYKIKDESCTIGLIAVDKEFRGKSIGTSLLDELKDRLIQKKINQLFVVTQRKNQPACRLYEKCGFVLIKVENVYHFWIHK